MSTFNYNIYRLVLMHILNIEKNKQLLVENSYKLPVTLSW
jgi:hypothetical protein